MSGGALSTSPLRDLDTVWPPYRSAAYVTGSTTQPCQFWGVCGCGHLAEESSPTDADARRALNEHLAAAHGE